MIGQTLGPYRILEKLGEGGMGEVYRARDTRLDRTVAIKVLPAGAAADPERRRRFEQEARAVSALDHPRICVLHDIGSGVPLAPSSPSAPDLPDAAGAPTDFLVMEFVEGQTLAQRLVKGPLSLDEALEAGAQIADALSAAHRHGIIHRDLKPANVMLTKAGVKLLDFGLAKLKSPPVGSGAGATTLATQTEDGRVMGTAPYMAPEQVEAKPADARTDLFAFGAVLYEMVTGRRAFQGETAARVMAAILEHDPPALATLRPETPPALERLVKRCLAKAPDERWDSAHDVADELRWIREPGSAVAVPASQARRRRSLLVALGVGAGVLSFAAGVGVTWLLPTVTPHRTPAHVTLSVGPAEEVRGWSAFVPVPGGRRHAITWTPDGHSIVFAGRRGGVRQLYVRRLDADQARPLANTEGAEEPAVSADSQWVAFWADGVIRKVPLGGGPVLDLAPGIVYPPWGMVWDASGRVLFGRGERGAIWAIPTDGAPAPVTTVREGELAHSLPWMLPGDRALIYTVRKGWWTWGDDEVVAQTLATGTRKVLLRDATDVRYLPTGHLVFMRRGVLFAVPFDADRLEPRGMPVAMLDGVAQALVGGLTPMGAGQFAVSTTGALAWLPGPLPSYAQGDLVAIDRRGTTTLLPMPARSYAQPIRLSPDGRRLAAVLQGLTECGRWVYDLDRGSSTLLSREGEATFLVWDREGQRLMFAWLTKARMTLATQPADATTPPRIVAGGDITPSSFTPDGRLVAAVRDSLDIVTVGIGNGRATVNALVQTTAREGWPEFSPDGRWLAYASNASGRFEVYVQPYPGPGLRESVSIKGGFTPAWNPNGRELFYLSCELDTCWLMAVDFAPGTRPRMSRPRPLFAVDRRTSGFYCEPVRCFDVSPDGQRFYGIQYRTPPTPPPLTHINLILNWFEELNAKVRRR